MSTENSFDMRGRLAALSFWHRISAADSDELVQFMATHSSLATTEKVLDELRAVLCGVGIVGTIDGFDVIRRDSVIDLVDRRRARTRGLQETDQKILISGNLLEALETFDDRLAQWAKAYPLDVFLEPDLAKAHKALINTGMTLDAISASNMRHVVTKLNELFEPVRAVVKEG